MSVKDLSKKLDDSSDFAFYDDGTFDHEDFYALMSKKFKNGGGFYKWIGIRYFLYEYELSLLEESRQQKVDWNSLLKTGKDRISIEHIYPQTETEEWEKEFCDLSEDVKKHYGGSLGNLLLLSSSINSSLQNDSFSEKKNPKFDRQGNKIRNGYSDGSHSEIEVSKRRKWGKGHIQKRGRHLLDFMEDRWSIKFYSSRVKNSLLFLDAQNDQTDEE